MEEQVGQWWHRIAMRWAERPRTPAAIELAQVQHTIGVMFRAAGGDGAVRVASASARQHGGARSWMQRVAGSGNRSAVAHLDAEVFALPPVIDVFDDADLNRDLYLWLAALAAAFEPGGEPGSPRGHDWIAGNLAASARTLARFAGLAARHQRLLAAVRASRPALTRLRGRAREAEAVVQAALRGDAAASAAVQAHEVAPVWLWLSAAGPAAAAGPVRREAADAAPSGAAPGDAQRRHAQRVDSSSERDAMLMFFRAESLLTWGEFVRVNRATDDEDDGHALAAANDMDQLAVTADGQAGAARIKFDLDLPSAAVDDLPLGAGLKLPEWDFKRRSMRPDHCAVQTLVARDAAPFTPTPALRRTARSVRRRMEVLRAAPHWQRGQADGDELDLDAWVRFSGEAARDEAPPVLARRVRAERSLATVLLADLSLSTDAHVNDSQRVIDVIRDALYVFGEALAASGDAFEVLGFSSVRRSHVRIQHLKGFDEAWGDRARARVGAIKPGYYTRMGAALRLATRRLQVRPERQRLLLLLTDGKPNDLDVYEGRYGFEDTREAVREARRAGLTPFAVSIDERAQDYLPHLFGARGFVQLHRPADLPRSLARLYATLAQQPH